MNRGQLRYILLLMLIFVGSGGTGVLVDYYAFERPEEQKSQSAPVEISLLLPDNESSTVEELTHVATPPITWEQAHHLTIDQMGAYWMLMRDAAVEFNRQTGIVPPRRSEFVPVDRYGECNNPFTMIPSSMIYRLCPTLDTIQIGADQMLVFYEFSWLAPAVLYGHEVGHAQQLHYTGLEQFVKVPSLKLENQADCLSGVFASWLRSQGIATDEDIEALRGVFLDISESITDPKRIHGSFSERWSAFMAGVNGGTFDACREFAVEAKITS